MEILVNELWEKSFECVLNWCLCVTGLRAAEHPNSHEEADETSLVTTKLVSATPWPTLEQTLPQTSGERTDPAPDTCPHFADDVG